MRERRRISLAADDRARIPFALVGVLLLVSSATYAGSLATSGPIAADRQVEQAVEGANAATTPAMRQAVAAAARDAAREPVTRSTENSTVGAVRNDTAFEDALKIRIALAVGESLAATETRRGSVTAVTRTPAITDRSDLAAARERVAIEPVANGTALAVTHRNVTTVARRDGRVVSTQSRNRTVVVPVPVLAAHERTQRFERRLNRDPTAGPGLGRRLTASLYPMVWARGYAQYSGAPIQNVLANRHVELSTNAAIAREQRAVFGRSDPGAAAGVRRAALRTGMTDLLAPTEVDERRWTDAVLDGPATGTGLPAEPNRSERVRTVSVDRSADAAFLRTVDDLDSIARDAYRVEASLQASVVEVGDTRDEPTPPGENWTLVEESVATSTTVADADTGASGRNAGDDDATGFGTSARIVTVQHDAVRRWTDGRDERRTRASWVERFRVVVVVDGTYAPRASAPDRPTAPTFEPGGWAGGPNLADAPRAARQQLGATDVDAVAREAVTTDGVTRRTTLTADRPANLDSQIRSDLAALRDEVRETETRVAMRRVASGEADPYGRLAAAIRDRRAKLVDAPATYDGASDRARVAARAAYVDAVLAKLEARAATDAETSTAIDDTVDVTALGNASVSAYVGASTGGEQPESFTIGAAGPGGDLAFTPRGAPGYLPRTVVSGRNVNGIPADERVRPLATRNVNYVTLPTADVASSIVGRLLGDGETVRLAQGGRALIAADRALTAKTDPELRADRAELSASVAESIAVVEDAAAVTLRAETPLTARERRATLAAARARWNGTGRLAVAMGNGSYATAVAAETAARSDLSGGQRAVLESRLRVDVAAAADGDAVRVPAELTNDTATRARGIARETLEAEVTRRVDAASASIQERWAPKTIRSVSSGLPVTPVPGYWYATVNAWRVDVAGAYPRFELRADTGPPGQGFRYVREAGAVTVEVGNQSVLLGHTDPVRFETGTVVVVAVPPGPPGVGDVDGVRTETSPGWPCPDGVGEKCEAGKNRDIRSMPSDRIVDATSDAEDVAGGRELTGPAELAGLAGPAAPNDGRSSGGPQSFSAPIADSVYAPRSSG
ncbi:DUF7286 family protein [Haloparvum sp. AD34]